MLEQIVRGPVLYLRDNGEAVFHGDGVLAFDGSGIIQFCGAWEELRRKISADVPRPRESDGVILPPLLDIHTHISQHPIRGRFAEGITDDMPGGRLLNSLKRNVFPAEVRCNDPEYAERLVREFLADTLSHGVVGGAAYMTVSAAAAEIALQILPPQWSVGMVLMNQNCPEDLRTDEANLDVDTQRLATRFGRRAIVTDRFAVSVSSPLRRRASKLAEKFSLRTQTHLNEQSAEKKFVEEDLYPDIGSYTDVYLRDGLFDHHCIVAHCIHMRPLEWEIVSSSGCAVAHCPTSNLLLGSGLMALEKVRERRIPYAIATDVGASGTVSMLAEIARFLKVHKNSAHATPAEALFRATLAPANILELDRTLGRLEMGRPASFIEVEPRRNVSGLSAEEAIRALLPEDLDNPSPSVRRVTLAGKVVFERGAGDA
jgi:guanine deaminase